MSENQEGQKKVSIGDALDAIRSGKNLPAEAKSGPKLPPTNNFEYQRVSPSYWLENLQEGIQRSRDQLFDSIASDPKSANGMSRRDLHATEAFFVPSEWVNEVDLSKTESSAEAISAAPAQEINIGAASPSSEASTVVSDGTRFNSSENLNVQALHVEEVESEDGGGEMRVRVNPMIREIFKKKSEG